MPTVTFPQSGNGNGYVANWYQPLSYQTVHDAAVSSEGVSWVFEYPIKSG